MFQPRFQDLPFYRPLPVEDVYEGNCDFLIMISVRIGFSGVGTLLSLLRKAPKTSEEIAS